jgi:hypothetical protein
MTILSRSRIQEHVDLSGTVNPGEFILPHSLLVVYQITDMEVVVFFLAVDFRRNKETYKTAAKRV